jgi:hypothetical protein
MFATPYPEVWSLTDLVDLQLSNNRITALPDAIGHLVELERLGLAGNRLRSLPEVWPGRYCYCLPCHRMPFNSRNDGSTCARRWMT